MRQSFTGFSISGFVGGLALVLPSSAATGATAPSAPRASAESVAMQGLLDMTLGLIAVLLMVAGAAWFLRRFGRFQGVAAGSLKLLGGLSMGTRERVVLVQVGDRQLLLGVTPASIRTLYVLEEPIAFEPEMSVDANAFPKWLKSALEARKPGKNAL